MKRITNLLITFLFLLQAGTAVSSEVLQGLLARYHSAFVRDAIFDYEVLLQLELETRRYFYENETDQQLDGDALVLHRYFNKLVMYLNFYRVNVAGKNKSLAEWNYYRLVLDALHTVDHRRAQVEEAKSSLDYYEVMHRGANNYLARSLSSYRYHFPFVAWSPCQQGDCNTEVTGESWSSPASLLATIKKAIDKLNEKLAVLHEARRLSKDIYRSAYQEYLRACHQIIASPYSGVVLLVLPKITHLQGVKSLPYPSVKDVSAALARINRMFRERQQQLASLYSNPDKSGYVLFIIRYHRQMFAEFMVRYPRFFNINNHYLDMLDVEYEAEKVQQQHLLRKHFSFFASSLGLTYFAVHEMLGARPNLLYYASILGGLGSTLYFLLKDKALTRFFPLRAQTQEMKNSLLLRQADDFNHLIYRLGKYEDTKEQAVLQTLLVSLYSFVLFHNFKLLYHLKSLKSLKSLKELDAISGYRRAIGAADAVFVRRMNGNRASISLRRFEEAMRSHPHPERLPLADRLALIDEFFGDYKPYLDWKSKYLREGSGYAQKKELSTEQLGELKHIGLELAKVFDPVEAENIAYFSRLVGVDRDAAIVNLERIKSFIKRMFREDTHRGDYTPTF